MPDDVVMQKLASIDRCLRAVRDYVAGDLNRLHEPIVLDAVVLNLQRACEQAIDAACREVARRSLGVPVDGADAFTLLERDRVLSPVVAERMRRMVGFRNIAVHEYRRLDPAVVRTVVAHRLGDFEALCRELAEADCMTTSWRWTRFDVVVSTGGMGAAAAWHLARRSSIDRRR